MCVCVRVSCLDAHTCLSVLVSVRERVLLRAWTHLCIIRARVCLHPCLFVYCCGRGTLLCVLVCIYRLECWRFRQFGHACSPGRSSCPLTQVGCLAVRGPPPAPSLQQLPGGWLSTASSSVGQKEAGPSDQTRREGVPGRGSAPGGRPGGLVSPSPLVCTVLLRWLWPCALGSLCARRRKSSEPCGPLPPGCVSVGRDLQGFRLRAPAPADHHPVLA